MKQKQSKSKLKRNNYSDEENHGNKKDYQNENRNQAKE